MNGTYYILNVFSDEGIRGGNQLAVFPDAQGMTLAQMQDITKQFNFSESTFVTSKNDIEADVRIFTPQSEILYAGHPTIGTLNVLETLNRSETGESRTEYSLNLQGGKVKGTFHNNPGPDTLAITYFEQLPSKLVEVFENRSLVCESLGIRFDDVVDDHQFYINAVTSMKFLFVQVKNQEILSNLEPDFKMLSQGEFLKEDICIYVFTTDPQDGGTLRARFFVPLYGIPEDPATGGIQSSFGLCLNQLGLLKNNQVNEVIVEQGYEMGRPSKIYNRFYIEENKLVKTETGGRCYYFSKGELV